MATEPVCSMHGTGPGRAGANRLGSEEQLAITKAITDLTPVELKRLRYYARQCACLTGQDEDDLVQEAILASLSGRRRWNRNLEILQHLFGSIKGIAFNSRRRYQRQEALPEGFDIRDDRPSPDAEAKAVAEEIMEKVRATLSEPDRQVLDLTLAGHRRAEIRAMAGCSSYDIDSANRRIRKAVIRCGGQLRRT